MSDEYEDLPASDKWGCLVATLVGAPLFFTLMFVDALGDCPPEPTSCKKGFLLMVLLPSLIVTEVVFGIVRAVIRSR